MPVPKRKIVGFVSALGAVLLIACGSSGEGQPEPAAAASPTKASNGALGAVQGAAVQGAAVQGAAVQGAVAPSAPPSGPMAEDARFELRATATGPYRAGEPAIFAVTLTPRGEYHINQEYPIEVRVTAPAAVTLPKATLARADAAEFADAKARFDVPFTATAGTHALEVKVDFAVCTPSTCEPTDRTLSLSLPVE